MTTQPPLTYERWKLDNAKTLHQLTGKNILLLFTGGKDCSLLLEFFLRVHDEFNLSLRVVAGTFPNHCFRKREVEIIRKYWASKGIMVEFNPILGNDRQCNMAFRQGGNPCDVCHRVRLDYLSRLTTGFGNQTSSWVVVYGFTLWDLVSYSLEYLLGSQYAAPLSKSIFQRTHADKRFTQRTSKRFPLLYRHHEGYYVYQPMVLYNDPEIVEGIKLYNTKLLTIPCKYTKFRPKRLLSAVYEAMDLNFDHSRVYSFVQNAFLKEVSRHHGATICR